MIVNIFSKGKGWYTPVFNYKDKNEKPFMVWYKFVKGYTPEPTFIPDDEGRCKKTIIINQASFNKYIDKDGEINFTISVFNYELPEKNNDVNVELDDLPFY